jgi:hypothetical protein
MTLRSLGFRKCLRKEDPMLEGFFQPTHLPVTF